MPPLSVEGIHARAGVTIAALDKKTFSFNELSESERRWVEWVFDTGIKQLKKISPVIADDIARQKELAVVAAGIAKAAFPSLKDYTFPSTPGNLGVAWLDPYTFKYRATPSPSYPCYTSSTTHTWAIPITAQTPAYIMGTSTEFYRSSITTDARSYVLVFENGLIEYGSTPAVQQFQLGSDGKADYGAYNVPPLIELPIEKNVAVYQYPTPLGAVLVGFDRGIRWGFMPRRTGTMTLKLLGMVFYEHDFLKTLTSAG